MTRNATFAPPTGTPLYCTAFPGTFTTPFSLAASFGTSSSVLNFGRLYSSTPTATAPSPVTVWMVMRPVSRSRGAVKLPLNDP